MKINLGVFFGGTSVEHEISVISAIQAIHSLDSSKYSVVPVYIGKDGTMYTGSNLLNINNYANLERLLSSCDKVTISRNGKDVCVYRTPPRLFGNRLASIDIAFPIVHGTNCEDGTMQGFFELLRLPYVGSDIISSALGMDKLAMKQVLRQHEIPMVRFDSFYIREWNDSMEKIISRIETDIGYPVIVKPGNLGSSIGIKKAEDRKQLEDAVSLAGSFASRIIVEKVVKKLKEINCSVLGDYDEAVASACEEPIGRDDILSYTDKYVSKSSSKGMSSAKRKLPADLKPEQEKLIKELAVKTFKALGCSGVARVDFLIDMEDNEKIYVNEINTIPGSLSFYLWEESGKPYRTLLSDMIDLAFKRDRERKNLMFTYDSNIFSMHGTGGFKNGGGLKGGIKGGIKGSMKNR